MSKKKSIGKKIKNDKRFIPFNLEFDYDYVLKYLKEYNLSHSEIELSNKAGYSIYFNQYYDNLKLFYDFILKKNNLSNTSFVELIITLANRDFYLVSQKQGVNIDNKQEIHYDDIINSSIKSSIPEMPDFNIQAGLEASHDGLNAVMNLCLQFPSIEKETKINFEHIDNSFKLLRYSNLYIVVKSSYDIAIWENYNIIYKKEKKELYIKCNNKKEQILNSVGQYRLERNLFYSKLVILSAFKERNDFYKKLEIQSYKNRKGKRLKKLEIKNFEIVYQLASGVEKVTVLKELLFISDLTTYYPFIKNENLPKFENINLFDIVTIHSEIQLLFQRTFEVKKTEIADNLSNFNKYRVRIKKTELINYILSKTRYNRNQIKQILEIFIENISPKYFNVWERPLIEIDGYIYPILFCFLTTNSLRTIDYWLDYGGFDLDKRGKMFEEYLKTYFKQILTNKGYYSKIPEKNIFKIKNGSFEEIDLIIELKNVTIIAEVKSIKFPFDTRDFHNMRKRLNDGSHQIIRKTKFLIKNKANLKQTDFLNKKIIQVVITNYPIFSGYVLNGIPIIDASLLDNYFIKGSLDKDRFNSDGLNNQQEITHSIKYYKNEDEFSNNIENFFNKPIPIYEKMDDYYVEENLISYPDANPSIKMDYVKSKQENMI